MKTNSRFLNIISSITNIAWYLNMVYIVFMFAVVIIGFGLDDHVAVQLVAVKYQAAPHAVMLKPIEPQASSAHAFVKEAEITVRLLVTPMVYIAALLFVAFLATLSTGILYHLRKVFAAVKQKQPFQLSVVKSLKMIALLLALITPIHLLYVAVNYFALTHAVVDFNKQFMMVWSENFIGLILGAVIYIIADIFKYGIQLKKETEEFV